VKEYEVKAQIHDDGTVNITICHENEDISTDVIPLKPNRTRTHVTSTGGDEMDHLRPQPMMAVLQSVLNSKLTLFANTVVNHYVRDHPETAHDGSPIPIPISVSEPAPEAVFEAGD
jgi:hypothetical protein